VGTGGAAPASETAGPELGALESRGALYGGEDAGARIAGACLTRERRRSIWTGDNRRPDDIDALRALSLNALAERDAALAERDGLADLNDRLRRLLRKAQGFEANSERLAKLDPKLNLALEDLEQAIAKSEALGEKTNAAETANQPPGVARPLAAHSRDRCGLGSRIARYRHGSR
jgi:hypothetical protein